MKARSEGSSTMPGAGDRCTRAIVGVSLLFLLFGLVSAIATPAAATVGPAYLSLRLAHVEPVHSPWAPVVPPGDWTPTTESRVLANILWRSPLEDAEERRARIARHRPLPIEQRGVFTEPLRQAAVRSARLFEAARDWPAALFAYERALALGADDSDAWRRVARVRLQLADGPGAEAAQLAALELLGETDDAITFVEMRARIHRDLALIYLLGGRLRDAQIALESATGLRDSHSAVALWLGRKRYAIDVGPPARPLSVAIDWPMVAEPSWLDRTRDVVITAETVVSQPVRENLIDGIDWLNTGSRRQVVTTVAFGLALLFVLLRMIRQRGDLIVNI
jgi:hypothetical protein